MNKTLKKTLSIIFTILMIVTTIPMAFAADVSLVINMTDSDGDGWNGNAVVIKQLIDGTYTEVATATIEDGESGTFTAFLQKDDVYAFSWVEGKYPDECSFTVAVNGETVYECANGRTLTNEQLIYTYCQHDWSNKDGMCAKDCGYACPHESYTDGKCDDCGAEGTLVTITMNDSFDDGWNGNAVVIEQLIDGTYTEVARATFNSGSRGTFAIALPKDGVYAFKWVEGSYSYECSFTVTVNGETVYECANGRTLTNEQLIYTYCQHDWSNKDGICANGCGEICTHENYTDDICDNCGAQKADYSEYFDALDRYYALTDEYADILVDKTGDYIKGKVQELVDEYLGDEEISGNFSVEKQYIIDGIADGVNEICDTIEKGIADGTLIIADYTEIDEAINAIDEALENATISEEMAAELTDIKAQLEELKQDENATMADVNELFERTEAITETMSNCADGNHTDEDGDYLCDNGCGHEFEKPVDPTPDTPDTPDEPTDDTCDRCGLVHTNIFQQLICMLMDLMNRVLDMLKGIFI